MGQGASAPLPPEGAPPHPAWRTGCVAVQFSGLSRLAGGQDGWADDGDSHGVYSFAVVWNRTTIHEFTERYSRALAKHKRALAAGVTAVEGVPFPSKSWLTKDMKSNTDNMLVRGSELARYYTAICEQAVGDAVSQRVLLDVFGVASGRGWPTPAEVSQFGSDYGFEQRLPDGELALACEGTDGSTVLVEVRSGRVCQLLPAPIPTEEGGSGFGRSIVVRAERQLWEELSKAILERVRPDGTPTRPPAEAASAIQERLRLHNKVFVSHVMWPSVACLIRVELLRRKRRRCARN